MRFGIEGKWIYGIPNPKNKKGYLYSDCPGKLFIKFKDLFYQKPRDEIVMFLDFLDKLEFAEGKINSNDYNEKKKYLGNIKN